MLYLTADELTCNILAQSEKAAAVIGSIDFKKADFDHNAVIIPFLGNIFDSAVIVLALESGCGTKNECYREPEKVLSSCCSLSREMSSRMANISNMRLEYDGFGKGSEFNLGKCLDFLIDYCKFMGDFLEKSVSAQKIRQNRDIICGFADIVSEKTGTKKTTEISGSEKSSENTADLLRRLIKETQRTNQLLEKLIEKGEQNG